MAKIEEKPDFSGIGTSFKVVYTHFSGDDSQIKVTTRSRDLKKQLEQGYTGTALSLNEFRTHNNSRVCGYLKGDKLYIIGKADDVLEGRYKNTDPFYCNTPGTASYNDSISLSLSNQQAEETGVVSYGYPAPTITLIGFWEFFFFLFANREWSTRHHIFFTLTSAAVDLYNVGGSL